MQIDSNLIQDVLVVKPLEKRLDAASATQFKGHLTDWINEGHLKIILDLTHVDFMDSSGLAALLTTLKTVESAGALAICNPQPAVMSLFEVTRVQRVLMFYPSVEAAVAELGERKGL